MVGHDPALTRASWESHFTDQMQLPALPPFSFMLSIVMFLRNLPSASGRCMLLGALPCFCSDDAFLCVLNAGLPALQSHCRHICSCTRAAYRLVQIALFKVIFFSTRLSMSSRPTHHQLPTLAVSKACLVAASGSVQRIMARVTDGIEV
jgi:hypothetical protein